MCAPSNDQAFERQQSFKILYSPSYNTLSILKRVSTLDKFEDISEQQSSGKIYKNKFQLDSDFDMQYDSLLTGLFNDQGTVLEYTENSSDSSRFW